MSGATGSEAVQPAVGPAGRLQDGAAAVTCGGNKRGSCAPQSAGHSVSPSTAPAPSAAPKTARAAPSFGAAPNQSKAPPHPNLFSTCQDWISPAELSTGEAGSVWQTQAETDRFELDYANEPAFNVEAGADCCCRAAELGLRAHIDSSVSASRTPLGFRRLWMRLIASDVLDDIPKRQSAEGYPHRQSLFAGRFTIWFHGSLLSLLVQRAGSDRRRSVSPPCGAFQSA